MSQRLVIGDRFEIERTAGVHGIASVYRAHDRASGEVEEVRILKGHVSKDHVHLFVSIPPQVTISRVVQRLKGRSSHTLMME